MINHTEADTYLQTNPFLGKNLILWLLGMLSLLGSLCSLLHRLSPVLTICFLMIGVTLEVLWVKTLSVHDEQLLKFVEEASSFVHKCQSPLTPSEITDKLKSEGFLVKEYPYGNYHCFRQVHKSLLFHFFISNNDTPDCKEAEAFALLFTQKMAEANASYGQQFFVAFEYGAEIQEKAPDFVALCQKGFMITKDQGVFGFRVAYDTKTDTLYFAEAVTRIIWRKKALLDRYTSQLFQKLFLSERN